MGLLFLRSSLAPACIQSARVCVCRACLEIMDPPSSVSQIPLPLPSPPLHVASKSAMPAASHICGNQFPRSCVHLRYLSIHIYGLNTFGVNWKCLDKKDMEMTLRGKEIFSLEPSAKKECMNVVDRKWWLMVLHLNFRAYSEVTVSEESNCHKYTT